MFSRREFIGTSLGAGALALTPELLRALHQSSGTLIQRAIPSSGEKLPAVGLSFNNHPTCADQTALRQVLKAFADGGGRLFDAMHVNPASEQFHITAANDLGIQNKVFWSMRGTPASAAPSPEGVKPQIESLLAKLKVSKIDLVMLPVMADPAIRAALMEEKKAGRVRYVGVQTIVVKSQATQLEAIMRSESIDFIGVDYDVSNRVVEDAILPLAQQRKIAVMAFFPFNNAFGVSCAGGTTLFTRAANKTLPDWAAEFDAKTWAQFFLKYVLGHPAVTVARTATTKPAHMLDNIGGGIGRLPNEAMRKRMAELVDALPPGPPPPGRGGQPPVPPGPVVALSAAILDRYVGDYVAASGFVATFRRDGDKLFVKPGNNPEVALINRSETRFQDPRGPYFEFQLDAQGKVTGAVLEQQGAQGVQKIPLTRK